MPQKLQFHPNVEKALANLRAMGLKVDLLPESYDECFLFITIDSMAKIIERRIPHPSKKVTIEPPFIVVHLWRQPR